MNFLKFMSFSNLFVDRMSVLSSQVTLYMAWDLYSKTTNLLVIILCVAFFLLTG